MKKKFKDTKAGRVLGGIFKGAIREIPIIGGIIDNLKSPEGGLGKLEKTELAGQIIAGGIVSLSLAYAFGWVDSDAFELIFTLLSSMFQ